MFLLTTLFFAGVSSCTPTASGSKKAGDSLAAESAPPETVRIDTAARIAAYKKACAAVTQKQAAFQKRYAAADQPARDKISTEARTYLLRMLTDSIFPAWYETTWDFNGVTQEPLTGSIACGYFVTTTLQQSKFDIERVFLAQQASSLLIQKLCDKDRIKVVTNGQLDKLISYMQAQPDGVYILGLDNHVGYVVKKGKTLDMVHSSYWPQVKVVRETMAESAIVKESKYFMVGNVLHSKATMEAWLTGTAIR